MSVNNMLTVRYSHDYYGNSYTRQLQRTPHVAIITARQKRDVVPCGL